MQLALSASEAAEFSRRPPKAINFKGTRLKPSGEHAGPQQQPPLDGRGASAPAIGLSAPACAGWDLECEMLEYRSSF